jgi:hypothetical protein
VLACLRVISKSVDNYRVPLTRVYESSRISGLSLFPLSGQLLLEMGNAQSVRRYLGLILITTIGLSLR